jgi:Solute carrier family 52, riboflavin transporter
MRLGVGRRAWDTRSHSRFFPSLRISLLSTCRTDSWTIGFNHLLGVAVCVLLAFFWQVQLSGHSVGLFVLTFFGGVTGALSVVTYYPFATRFGMTPTSAVSTGMGKSFCTSWCSLSGRDTQLSLFWTSRSLLLSRK